MNYRVIQSNSAVNVIEVDGQIIQLSASIDIDDYLQGKYKPLAKDTGRDNTNGVKAKASKTKRPAPHNIAKE